MWGILQCQVVPFGSASKMAAFLLGLMTLRRFHYIVGSHLCKAAAPLGSRSDLLAAFPDGSEGHTADLESAAHSKVPLDMVCCAT